MPFALRLLLLNGFSVFSTVNVFGGLNTISFAELVKKPLATFAPRRRLNSLAELVINGGASLCTHSDSIFNLLFPRGKISSILRFPLLKVSAPLSSLVEISFFIAISFFIPVFIVVSFA